MRTLSIALALVGVGSATLVRPAVAPAAGAERCGSGEVRRGDRCEPIPEVARQVTSRVKGSVRDRGLNAAIFEVRVGNRLVTRSAVGKSMTGVPATTRMHFRVGAVSVSYLATVLLQLADEGRLSLDDAVSEWYPDLPRADEVTLRMLINSTSGYADYVGEGLPIYDDPFRRWTAAELIEFGLSKPAACDPGTCFNYSHTNFVILGEILREVTGRPVSRLIRKRVVRPLALRETQSNSTARIRRPVLHAFTSERGGYEESTFWNPSWTIGPGAVMTSDIADVARSAKAIGTGELVSRRAHREQVGPSTADVPPLSPELYYGLGVLVRNGWIVQNPSLAGYSAVMAYLPAGKVTIAVASTNGPDSPEEANTQEMFTELAAYLSPDTEPPVLP